MRTLTKASSPSACALKSCSKRRRASPRSIPAGLPAVGEMNSMGSPCANNGCGQWRRVDHYTAKQSPLLPSGRILPCHTVNGGSIAWPKCLECCELQNWARARPPVCDKYTGRGHGRVPRHGHDCTPVEFSRPRGGLGSKAAVGTRAQAIRVRQKMICIESGSKACKVPSKFLGSAQRGIPPSVSPQISGRRVIESFRVRSYGRVAIIGKRCVSCRRVHASVAC